MRIALLTFLAFIGGLVAGYLVAAIAGLFYVEYAGASDREGAISMGIIFMIGPLVGIVSGVLAAIFTTARLRRRTAPSPSRPTQP